LRPGAIAPRRRTLLLALACALALLLVAAPQAFAGALTPESGGSPNANDINTLYKIVLYVALVIFLLVESVLIWSLVKFRRRRGGPPPQQVRGNTVLEMGWTVGAVVIVLALTVVTFLYLGDIKNPSRAGPGPLREVNNVKFASINQPRPPGGEDLPMRVNGQQYLWRYEYPGPAGTLFSYFTMVVPTHTTVTLKITSQDVAHSWWIPKLGGKADAIPGHVNETWFRIDKPGTYRGQCAELCGDNHADMRAQVVALPQAQYEAWTRRQKADIANSKRLLAFARQHPQLQ
jgi:cytochrome c oxidase subunit II